MRFSWLSWFLGFVAVSLVSLVAISRQARGDCPSAPECKCAIGTPTLTPDPTPPACYDHTDAAVVGDGSAKDGCCRLAGDATCNTEKGCYYKFTVTAVGTGSGCDFSINQGGVPIATCPTSPCTSVAAVTSGHFVSCGGTEQFTVRVGGVRVCTVTMGCGNC